MVNTPFPRARLVPGNLSQVWPAPIVSWRLVRGPKGTWGAAGLRHRIEGRRVEGKRGIPAWPVPLGVQSSMSKHGFPKGRRKENMWNFRIHN
jgi:hypothetical protein